MLAACFRMVGPFGYLLLARTSRDLRMVGELHGRDKRTSGTCIQARNALPPNSFPGAPERIREQPSAAKLGLPRTSDLRFRKLCAQGLRGSQRVLGTRNLAKRGKPCPDWSFEKLQQRQHGSE
jgi:hypothetical protein